MDFPFWLSTIHHHRPGTQIQIRTLPQPRKDLWHTPLQNNPHHPAANGLVERLHLTMKAAIMCHANDQWTDSLPLVLLGIRTAYKGNLQASTEELVYGEPLRSPGELLVSYHHCSILIHPSTTRTL